MTRRGFLHRMLLALAAATPVGAMNACARGQDGPHGGRGKPHYRALEGRSLRDIVARRLHHGDDRFVNPFNREPRGGLGRLIQWKLLSANRFKTHYESEPVTPVKIDREAVKHASGLSITFLKHASLLIKDMDAYILVDPVFGELFWFIDDFSPLAFDPRILPEPRHVLITHGHYDHLDMASLQRLGRNTHVVTPLGYDDQFETLGMTNRRQLDWYDGFYADGREITLLPCNHWTMRNPITGPNTSLWGSYLIRTKAGATIYLSGDTGYFDGFAQIGAEFDIDLAVFNLGAYEPRWFMAPSHINPSETVRAFQELGARHLMIAHWGTFRLGDEPVHFPPIDLQRELDRAGLRESFLEIRHGQTLSYT